jgi:hypothetical protein
MAKYDIKNIICINLQKFNLEQLKKISFLLGINYDSLESNKKFGFIRMWFDKDSLQPIAFTHKDNKNRMNVLDEYLPLSRREEKELYVVLEISLKDLNKKIVTERVNNVNVKEATKQIKTKVKREIVFDVDFILDKISTYGIDSITKEERDFLDSRK